MTKEVYKERLAEITDKISSLRQEIKTLDAEYIEANKEYTVDEKVYHINSRGSKTLCFVVGYEVYFGNLVPILYKSKKDGSKSSIKQYFNRSNEKIEKL